MSYVNKKLSFTRDDESKNIFISIIRKDQTSISLEVNTIDFSDFLTKISDFLKLPDTFKEDANALLDKNKITFEKIFSIFGLLQHYHIYLFLLDYSCSIFSSTITNDQYLNFMANTYNVARGGKIKRKTIKRQK